MEMKWLILTLLCAATEEAVVQRMEYASPVVLRDFKSFGSAEILHYSVPPASHIASWRFRAHADDGCSIRNVSISLRHGSYPLLNPDGVPLPDNLYIPASSFFNTSLLSDNQTAFFNVSNPRSGDWFVAAVLVEASSSINPGGLLKSCPIHLFSSVAYSLEDDVIFVVPEIHDFQNVKLYQEVRGSQYYKFFVPADTWMVNVTVSKCSPSQVMRGVLCPVVLSGSAESLPSLLDPYTMWKNCSDDGRSTTCTFEFVPREEAWHFIHVETVSPSVEITLQIGYHSCSYQAPQQSYMMMTELSPRQICASLLKNITQHASLFRNVYYLIQRSQPDYFSKAGCLERMFLERVSGDTALTYAFQLPRDNEGRSVVGLEIPVSMNPYLFSFDLNSITDIGGTLVVGFSLIGKGYGRPLKVPETNPGIKVFGCLAHDQRAELRADGHCSSGLYLQVNSSFEAATDVEVLVPFPPPGRWYLMLMAQCYDEDGSRGYSPVDSAACRDEAAQVTFRIGSAPCKMGMCENSGACRLFMSSGFIFSSCSCFHGYRGLFCEDGGEAVPQYLQLISVLLLTLSNLMFIPAVGIAIIRKFYPEAVVYFSSMAASTLYHACDQQGEHSFCVLDLAWLQSLDFYCGLLAFWVTLLAMAALPWAWKSSFHVIGAIGILLAVLVDRQSVWAFVIPTAFAGLVLCTSWIIYCRLDRECYPGKRYLVSGLLPGVVLAGVGLAIFGFLQTEENYFWTHSAWHIVTSASICFLLPSVDAASGASRSQAFGKKRDPPRASAGGGAPAVAAVGFGRESGGSSDHLAGLPTPTATVGGTLKRSHQNRSNKRGSFNHGHVGEEGEDAGPGMDSWLAQSPTGNTTTIVAVSPNPPGASTKGQSSADGPELDNT